MRSPPLFATALLLTAVAARAQEDPLATRLAGVAARLLEALPEDAREDAAFPFDDDEREDIRFAPLLLEGARHGELPDAAASLTEELLVVSLGPRGMAKVKQIRLNERAVAAKDETRWWVPGFVVRGMRDPGRYFVALFGAPSPGTPWGYRYEGHHLSLNLTLAPGRAPASTPLFLGAEPRVVPEGSPEAGARVLG
ncbi:MAG: DUF3500 domain-containing protein, partial [Myxococcota bacterium]